MLATERHESHRVDRQLFGRSARQGDPGEAQAILSLEDELFQRHLPKPILRYLAHSARKDGTLPPFLSQIAIHLAQKAAEKLAFKMRKSVLRTDDWTEESLGFTGGQSGLG